MTVLCVFLFLASSFERGPWTTRVKGKMGTVPLTLNSVHEHACNYCRWHRDAGVLNAHPFTVAGIAYLHLFNGEDGCEFHST